MENKLKTLEDRCITVFANLKEIKTSEQRGSLVEFSDIRLLDSSEIIACHLWLDARYFDRNILEQLSTGDTVVFSGIVGSYTRDREFCFEKDYTLVCIKYKDALIKSIDGDTYTLLSDMNKDIGIAETYKSIDDAISKIIIR